MEMLLSKIFRSKVISFTLMLALVATSGSFAFAAAANEQAQSKTNSIAQVIEKVTGTEQSERILAQRGKELVAEGEYTRVGIPTSPDGYLELAAKGNKPIEIKLPTMMRSKKMMVSDNGTVIYGDKSDSSCVGVQALSYRQDGDLVEALQTVTTVTKANAAKTYDFEYKLPKGHKLIAAADYAKKFVTNKEEKAYFETLDLDSMIYVVNGKNRIVNTLDKSWAEDAKGNEIKVSYIAIIGLFDGGTLSVAFSLVLGGRDSFLRAEQEVYASAGEDCGIKSNRIKSVVFTYHYRGNWQGKNKGYVYTAEHTTSKYRK